jgi:putative membrane protein
MLWFKAFHLVFMVTWFAGLFYLPRLFVYHVEAHDPAEHQRLVVMERRLFAIMSIGGVLTLIFGIALLLATPHWLAYGWLHAKLLALLGLIAFHLHCRYLMLQLSAERCTRSSRWMRFYNEVPGVFLIAIVLLAVLKPF